MPNVTFAQDFGDKANAATEKAFKEAVLKKLKSPGCKNVKVSFSGRAAKGDLKTLLRGSGDEVTAARKRLWS
jgi:hypothetical protein